MRKVAPSRARAAGWRGAVVLLLAISCLGCFGDWVKAKKRPYRDELPPAPARVEPAPEEGPDHPCLVYQAEIAQLCESWLSGTREPTNCYAEILRLSAKPAIPDEKDDPKDRYTRRDRSCRADLALLQQQREEGGGRPAKGGIGPACQAWASDLRARCLEPLAQSNPTLPTRCGSWFMTFQSVVQGRAERREEACTRAQAAAATHEDDVPGAAPKPGERPAPDPGAE